MVFLRETRQKKTVNSVFLYFFCRHSDPYTLFCCGPHHRRRQLEQRAIHPSTFFIELRASEREREGEHLPQPAADNARTRVRCIRLILPLRQNRLHIY